MDAAVTSMSDMEGRIQEKAEQVGASKEHDACAKLETELSKDIRQKETKQKNKEKNLAKEQESKAKAAKKMEEAQVFYRVAARILQFYAIAWTIAEYRHRGLEPIHITLHEYTTGGRRGEACKGR